MEAASSSIIDRGRPMTIVVVIWILYSALVFTVGPWQEVANWKNKNNDAFAFDTRGGYSHADAIKSLRAYGTTGQKIYARHLIFDAFYLLLQTIAVSWLFLFTVRRLYGYKTRLQWFATIPILVGLLDLVEDAAIAVMLSTDPSAVPKWATGVAATVTSIKLLCLIGLPAILLASVIGLLVLRINAQSKRGRLSGSGGLT